jgi:tRNA pseudouridine38-40 synthase
MNDIKNFLLTIEYDGRDFFGWQRQPKLRTVQGELEEKLSFVIGKKIEIAGTSRTDAGVHALGQRATLKDNFSIPAKSLQKATNNLLSDVKILSIEEKPLDFHARYDACGKAYVYKIDFSSNPNIFDRNYIYQLIRKKRKIDSKNISEGFKNMKLAAETLVGEYDFLAFMSQGGNVPSTTTRTIYSIDIALDSKANIITITIVGNGFLYNMVRIIVGTLIEVLDGKRTVQSVRDTLESKDRANAGHTAPPEGLYLKEVYYSNIDCMAVAHRTGLGGGEND